MKILIKDLEQIRNDNADKKIVFLTGTFDLFHVGHLTYLRKAREFGDVLIVGVNSDSRTKRIKGSSRPFINQLYRAELVAAQKAVDFAFVMPQSGNQKLRPSLRILQKLQPDVFLVCDKGWLQASDFCASQGTKIIFQPRIHRTSTSHIVKKIIATQ